MTRSENAYLSVHLLIWVAWGKERVWGKERQRVWEGSDVQAINRIMIFHISVAWCQNATAGYCPLRLPGFNINKKTRSETPPKILKFPSGDSWQAWGIKPWLNWRGFILKCVMQNTRVTTKGLNRQIETWFALSNQSHWQAVMCNCNYVKLH